MIEMQYQCDITHVDISFENIMLACLRVWLLHSFMVITLVRNDSSLNACNHIQNTGVMAVVWSVMLTDSLVSSAFKAIKWQFKQMKLVHILNTWDSTTS